MRQQESGLGFQNSSIFSKLAIEILVGTLGIHKEQHFSLHTIK